MVQTQGGDISYLEDTNKFEKAKYIVNVKSTKAGKISEVNAEEIGKLAVYLGAGRTTKEDKIDMPAGIVLNKKVNDNVEKNETLATIHTNYKEKCEYAQNEIINIIKISY